MSARRQPRFDPDALRKLAGEKVFARGRAYCDEEQVQLLAVEPTRVLALVAGTEDYRTELTGRGRAIGGECSCPAFEDWGFCKHMVATALAVNAAGDGASEGVGATARIRAHLAARGADALAAMIMELAARDLALFRRLDLESAACQGDDATLETRLRRSVDAATRAGRYIDEDASQDWVAGILLVLDTLAAALSKGRAALVLGLSERLIDRVDAAAGDFDDPDGDCADVLRRAAEVHQAAARAAKPDPVALARGLFAREMAHQLGTFDGAAGDYAEALGEAGLAEYHRLARAAFEALPTPSARVPRVAVPAEFHRLSAILDGFMERAGDLDGRIALRAKDLSSAWSYFQLAEFCEAQGRSTEALKYAEDGLWIFADHRQDNRLLLLTTDLLIKVGRRADAAAHLWRAFESRPSLDLHGRLGPLDADACKRAAGFLESRLRRKTHTPQTDLADVLVGILVKEEMFGPAWKAAHAYGASEGIIETLARASESAYPREAVEAYMKAVERRLANAGGHTAYAEAAALIARMPALRGAAEQTAYMTALKANHGRKRNFMRLLA